MAQLAKVEAEHGAAAFLVSLLQYVVGFPRKDALDMLSQAHRPIVELVGVDAVNLTLEDVAQIWPS
ncbi:hypothetical protein VSR82_00105 [Burkholderia sp. JPY481]